MTCQHQWHHIHIASSHKHGPAVNMSHATTYDNTVSSTTHHLHSMHHHFPPQAQAQHVLPGYSSIQICPPYLQCLVTGEVLQLGLDDWFPWTITCLHKAGANPTHDACQCSLVAKPYHPSPCQHTWSEPGVGMKLSMKHEPLPNHSMPKHSCHNMLNLLVTIKSLPPIDSKKLPIKALHNQQQV